MELLHTLYPPSFGTAGAFFEIGALVAAIVLMFLVRNRRPAFAWTLVGTFFLGGESRSILDMGCSSKLGHGSINTGDIAGELDRFAQPMGVHSCRSGGSSAYWAWRYRVLPAC